MSGFVQAFRCELLKARRSRVPLWTALGLALAPMMGGLFMFIMKDPARARALGLLGAKAQLTTGTADWPTYLGVIAQATAVGGSFVFARSPPGSSAASSRTGPSSSCSPSRPRAARS